jgi:hypothetical protein
MERNLRDGDFSMSYKHGMDVLGDGIESFLPWLGVVSKVATGAMGAASKGKGGGAAGGTAAPSGPSMQQMMEQEHQRQALEKAQADAATTKMLLFGAIGLVVVGGLTFVIARK